MIIPSKMMAAVLYGFNDVRVEERAVSATGPEEALIKVEACGVCGGDIKIITKGMPKQPPFGEFIIGHEYAGTIAAVGEAVDELTSEIELPSRFTKDAVVVRTVYLENTRFA